MMEYNFLNDLNRDIINNERAFKKKIKSENRFISKFSKDTDKELMKFVNANILSDVRLEKRKPLSSKLKKEVYKKYNGKCDICGIKKGLDVHHVNFKNNVNKLINLRLLCVLHHRLQSHRF